MSVKESIEFIKEGNPVDNPQLYKEHALSLVEEIEKLKEIIINTTHGRRKIEKDSVIRTDIYSVKVGERIYISELEVSKQVVEDDRDDLYLETMIQLSFANELLSEGKAIRIPNQMNYGGNNTYDIINGNVICVNINKLDKDGSFHDWIGMWIPQPEKEKYVLLGVRFLGADIYGDRIYLDTSHYKKEEGWGSSYMNKRLARPGGYKVYVDAIIEEYRRITNRPDFLKKVKK